MKIELVKEIESLLVKNYTETRDDAKNGLYIEIRDKKDAAFKSYRQWSREHNGAMNKLMAQECKSLKAYCEYLLKMMHKSDETIAAEAAEDAIAYTANTEAKAAKIVGNITSWENVRLTFGTHYVPMLNGVVEGDNGKCVITTIEKGGYNIKRIHAATLVKKAK